MTQLLPKSQDDSGVAAEQHSGLYQLRGLAVGSPDLNPRDCECGPKASQQPGQSEDIPLRAATEIPLETVRVARADWPEGFMACVEAAGGHFG